MSEKEVPEKLTLENLSLSDEEREKVLDRAVGYRVRKALDLLGPEARSKNLGELLSVVKTKLDEEFDWQSRNRLFETIIRERLDGESGERLSEIREGLEALSGELRPLHERERELQDEKLTLQREANRIRQSAHDDVHNDARVLTFDLEKKRLQKAKDLLQKLSWRHR